MSCNGKSLDFGWNMNYGINVNPSRTIRRIRPHIITVNSGNKMRRIGFEWNSSDVIPPRNIGSFEHFNRRTSDFFSRSALCHGTAKIETEKPGGGIIFKNAGRKNNFEVERVGCKYSVILNNVH